MSEKKGGNVKPKSNALTVVASPGDEAAALARSYLRPTVQAAITVQAYSVAADDTGVTLDALVSELSTQCRQASSGDLGRPEGMLTAQAHTLDAIFGFCARRARVNMSEYPQSAELYLRLALKAQSQCRATLETLAAIKNPQSVAFVRQANIAHGPQQVNNSAASSEPSLARENENGQNKLLESDHGQRLDTRAPGSTGAANQDLETVGAIDRAEDRRG